MMYLFFGLLIHDIGLAVALFLGFGGSITGASIFGLLAFGGLMMIVAGVEDMVRNRDA